MSLHTLVLAAGRGSRFGGGLKQLADIAGQTMLQRALSLAQCITPDQVTVVLGYEHAHLSSLVESAANVFVNPQWQAGIGTSISCGVLSLPADASAVLIYLCDQVAITAGDLERLCAAYEADQSSIVCAVYADSLGVPAIFPRAYFSQLIALEGDRGAKPLLFSNPVLGVPLDAAVIDIDTYEQWQQFTKNLS